MQTRWMALAALCVSAASGCAEDQVVRFAELKDGDYLGDVAFIAIDTGDLRVASAELLVDDELAAASSLAPYELALDTTAFDEAPHTLTLRVILDDGDTVKASIAITIDNTAPRIGELGPSVNVTSDVLVPVTDNFRVDRVEVENSLTPDTILKGRGTSPVVAWPARCGAGRVVVRAFDRAGNTAERRFDVFSLDPQDVDCDGARAPSFGGADCDDQRAWVYPGAPELVEGFDFSCDGQVARRDGTDFDGDGVLSVSDGGDDCDDADPQIHGARLSYQRRPLRRDGAPLAWQPGEAVAADSALYLNRDGVVERIAPSAGAGDSTITELARGANPRSLAVSDGVVAFGRGTQIVLINTADLTTIDAIATSGLVGALAYQNLPSGESGLTRQVTYQSGTKVWLATHPGTGPWRHRLIFDPGEPLLSAPQTTHLSDGGVAVTLHTAQKLSRITVDRMGNAFESLMITGGDSLVATAPSDALTHVALRTPAGAYRVASWSGNGPPSAGLTFATPVTALVTHPHGLLIQLDDGATYLARLTPSLRLAQTLPSFGRLDVGSPLGLAGDSALYQLDPSSIWPVYRSDDRQLHRDSDCDGQR